VWRVLAELSNFFCILCAKELSRTVVAEMEQFLSTMLFQSHAAYDFAPSV